MAKVGQSCASIFLILLICRGGVSESGDQNEDERHEEFEGDPDYQDGRDDEHDGDQKDGEPEYVPRFLEFLGTKKAEHVSDGQNAGEPKDQNAGEPEYVPRFLELFGKLRPHLISA